MIASSSPLPPSSVPKTSPEPSALSLTMAESRGPLSSG